MAIRAQYLGDFAQSPALLPEINNDAAPAILRLLDSLFDAEDEVGPACADIGTKYVTAVTLRMGCQQQISVRARQAARPTSS